MSRLFFDLPGFATDFSGAASILAPLGGLVIIHAPSGCMGNYTGFDEPEWFSRPGLVLSSLMREDEAVLGLDSVVVDRTVATARREKPPFAAILGTPITALIGTDCAAIAAEIERECGIPTLGVDTTGFDSYQTGAGKAISALYDRFVIGAQASDAKRKNDNKKPPAVIRPGQTLNILGFSNLDYRDGDLVRLASLLEKRGCRIGSVVARGKIGDIARLPVADGNLVVSAAALPLAKRLREDFGQAFDCTLPVGGIWPDRKADESPSPRNEHPESKPQRSLIIGDQVVANALRDFIENRYGIPTDVATFFNFDRNIARTSDTAIDGEDALRDLLRQGYTIVVGDPLFEAFRAQSQAFIGLPHAATSSKLHWNDYVPPFSQIIVERLDECFTALPKGR